METIDVKTLEEAVTLFYRSGGSEQQQSAHEWLTKVQCSPQAWQFVWDLMQMSKVSDKITIKICKLLHVYSIILLFLGAFYNPNWQILSLQSSEVQYFGATTLHTKLVKYWHEVPRENQNELKQKLFESIVLFGNGPKIVLNRLCIAVSCVLAEQKRVEGNVLNWIFLFVIWLLILRMAWPPAECLHCAHDDWLPDVYWRYH